MGGNRQWEAAETYREKRQAFRRHSRAGGNLEIKNHGVIGNDWNRRNDEIEAYGNVSEIAEAG